jgi:hypothetical protein
MEEQIKRLVENTSNDIELGAAVRQLYWKNAKINEVKVDPRQITLDQLIAETKKEK